MFSALRKKINVVTKLNNYKLFELLFKDKEFKDFILELNTQTQLYDQGVGSDGNSIGKYSNYTINIKKEKGQPTDRVTLKDTGEFYKSFRVRWIASGNGMIQITANTMKEDTDLLVAWGKEILGLNEDSLSQLRYIATAKLKTILHENI